VHALYCELQPCWKWNVQYTGDFDLRPLPGIFWSHNVTSGSFQVTWGHMTSFPVTWLPLPASYSFVGSDMYSIREFWPSTTTCRWLPVKWHRFLVTFGNLSSRDVISCHVTAFSCELKACKKWNVEYTWDFGLLQPLHGDLRSNNVISGSPAVTWDQVTSFSVMWLPPPSSYSLVNSEIYSIREFFTFYSHFQVTFSQMTSLLGHFWSFEVTWRHFLSRDCLFLRATAL